MFEAYNESACLIEAVERFKARTDHYPERELADQIYRTRDNRNSIEVERTFSLNKRCYGMGCIVTKLEETQLASIALPVFVTKLFKVHKRILYALLSLFQYRNRYKRWSIPYSFSQNFPLKIGKNPERKILA